MNLLDFATTPLWLVWETVRDVAAEDGVDLAESELIGLAPLAAFLAVADRADAPVEDPVEARLAAAASVPAPARLLADAGPRAPTRGRSIQRTALHGERRPVPADPRRPER